MYIANALRFLDNSKTAVDIDPKPLVPVRRLLGDERAGANRRAETCELYLR